MSRADEARALADALEAYCERHRLARWRVSVVLFPKCRSGIAKLRKSKQPTRRTLERVRAFLASPPPPEMRRRPLGGKRIRRDNSTGEDLAAKLEALIAERGWCRRTVSLCLFNSPHGIDRLRFMKPQARTRARVQAFLRRPVLEDCGELRKRHCRPPVVRAPKPFVPRIVGSKPHIPLTFEEQLARVLSGKARVVPKLALPSRSLGASMVGCAAALAVEG